MLSDIQRAVGDVDEVFARINADPDIRFVVSTGDLGNTGIRAELERFQLALRGLAVPFFTTAGNHEMGAPPRIFHELFGAFNSHFVFRGVHFSFVDSGNATIDPAVYDRLGVWLEEARDKTHVVCTHVPPLDPVGFRSGAFRSRNEAAKLVAMLGRGAVDALFLGHIHSYYAFSSASIATYISGGGGAVPERFDGIGRHYLRVHASQNGGVHEVALVRID
ncbi:MAG: hypothetical protein RL385_1999 [Pseudomonadota bacterium]